jgi:predicted SnoaL-like aldol condensation-catalyzing enzyme
MDIVRVRDGKMTEHWNVVDVLALMTQLGAIPAPA